MLLATMVQIEVPAANKTPFTPPMTLHNPLEGNPNRWLGVGGSQWMWYAIAEFMPTRLEVILIVTAKCRHSRALVSSECFPFKRGYSHSALCSYSVL